MFTPAFLLLCVLFYVQAVPAPNHGALKGYCIVTDDCDPGDCCVAFNKQNINGLSEDLRRFVKGKCEPFGRKEAVCQLRSQGSGPLYQWRCPCYKGLTCTIVGYWGPIRAKPSQGRCRPPKSQTCRTNKDCSRGECCVSKYRPKGKRDVRYPGTCQKLGTYGSSCLVSNQVYPPKPIVFLACPCRSPYACVGTGIKDMPLGELGKCRIRRKLG